MGRRMQHKMAGSHPGEGSSQLTQPMGSARYTMDNALYLAFKKNIHFPLLFVVSVAGNGTPRNAVVSGRCSAASRGRSEVAAATVPDFEVPFTTIDCH
jgi:hypothetical protein